MSQDQFGLLLSIFSLSAIDLLLGTLQLYFNLRCYEIYFLHVKLFDYFIELELGYVNQFFFSLVDLKPKLSAFMKIIEFTLFVVNLIKQFEFRFKIFFVNGQYCWLNISLLCYCYSFKHLNNFDYFLFFQFINYLLCLYWFCLFVIYQYLVFFIFKMAWIPYYLDSTETKFSFNSLHYI